jgi:radical SAM protein with 4Fe4S-binding SPASM domain
VLALNPEVVVRPEAKGALLFHKKNGETVLIDKTGIATLTAALSGRSGPAAPGLPDLLFLERKGFFIEKKAEDRRTRSLLQACLTDPPREIPSSLSAPESLHIALTDACDQACPGCFYSKKTGRRGRFLSNKLYEKILNEAVRVKVFQFAFGGGEPLLHPRLPQFARRASERGIVPNVTTNGNMLTIRLAVDLKEAGLGQLQISLDSADPAVNSDTRPNFDGAVRAIEICGEAGLRFGINALITRTNFRLLPGLIDFARSSGAQGVNLLRPKPPALSPGWLGRTSLGSEENRAFHRLLVKRSGKGGIGLTLDQSLSFLAFHRKPGELFRSGVWGCGAGRRFLSIDPAGAVYPCSHYRKRIARDGEFMKAWTSSALLRRFRLLEKDIEGACRSCRLVSVCRGCRAVVKALGGGFAAPDPHCPVGSNLKMISIVP